MPPLPPRCNMVSFTGLWFTTPFWFIILTRAASAGVPNCRSWFRRLTRRNSHRWFNRRAAQQTRPHYPTWFRSWMLLRHAPLLGSACGFRSFATRFHSFRLPLPVLRAVSFAAVRSGRSLQSSPPFSYRPRATPASVFLRARFARLSYAIGLGAPPPDMTPAGLYGLWWRRATNRLVPACCAFVPT